MYIKNGLQHFDKGIKKIKYHNNYESTYVSLSALFQMICTDKSCYCLVCLLLFWK